MEIEDGPDASLIESAEKRLQLARASLQEAEDDSGRAHCGH